MLLSLFSSTSIAEAGETFEKPSIEDVLPPDILFPNTIFAFNRIDLIRIIAVIVLLTVFCLAAKRAKVIPSRFQSVIEMIIFFVKDQIVDVVMSPAHSKKYLTFAVTLFSSIAVFNLCSLIPGLNLAGTAAIGLPLAFAVWTVFTYWKAGIQQFGFLGFLRHELFPPAIPPAIWPLIAPIELLQLLVTRPFSLTVRLLCNMISGHMLLAVCVAGTQFLVFNSDWIFKPLGFLTFLGVAVFTAFEAFVGVLQAYIFTLLSISYIEQSYPDVDHEVAEASYQTALSASATPILTAGEKTTNTTLSPV
jgi:F-type H+-transporting ATPase subunit a